MIVPSGRIAIINRFPGSIPQRGGGVMVSHPSTRRPVLFLRSKKSSLREPGEIKVSGTAGPGGSYRFFPVHRGQGYTPGFRKAASLFLIRFPLRQGRTCGCVFIIAQREKILKKGKKSRLDPTKKGPLFSSQRRKNRI